MVKSVGLQSSGYLPGGDDGIRKKSCSREIDAGFRPNGIKNSPPAGFNTPVSPGKLAHYPPVQLPANAILLNWLRLQRIPHPREVWLPAGCSKGITQKCSKGNGEIKEPSFSKPEVNSP